MSKKACTLWFLDCTRCFCYSWSNLGHFLAFLCKTVHFSHNIKKVEFALTRSAGLRTKLSMETPGDGSAGETQRESLLGNSDGSADSGDDPAEWDDGEDS